jgi:hypothetical protein
MQFFELLPKLWINPDQITRIAIESEEGKEVVKIHFSDRATETLAKPEHIKKFRDKFKL